MMLHQRQHIELTGQIEDWFYNLLENANISCLPVTEAIAIKSACLELYHRDPADRFIIAN